MLLYVGIGAEFKLVVNVMECCPGVKELYRSLDGRTIGEEYKYPNRSTEHL